jgi:phospholipid/cholesterol/gamma-HCH transport system substrate-binding protein
VRAGPVRGRGWAALAVIGLLSAGCGLSLQSMPKIGGLGGPTYQLHATFSNVLNLPANAPVREGSALVGQVGSITTHDFKAYLVLNIRKDVRLPVGTAAQTRFDSPLGDDYIVLQVPAQSNGPWLTDGAVLAENQTSTAPSVEDTLAALSAVLNGGGINQLGVVISELNKTFHGNEPQIRGFLEQITTAVSSLSAHSQDIDIALTAIGNLNEQLSNGSGTITAGIDAIAPAVTVLANENNDLAQLNTNVSQLAAVANSIFSQSANSVVNDVNQLLPVLNQLSGVAQQLGPALADIASFEVNTPKIAPGNYLQVAITAGININSNPNSPTVSAGVNRPSGGSSGSGSASAVTSLLSGGLL